MRISCADCRFFQTDISGFAVEGAGFCKRYPSFPNEGPRTSARNWCGEFQYRLRWAKRIGWGLYALAAAYVIALVVSIVIDYAGGAG